MVEAITKSISGTNLDLAKPMVTEKPPKFVLDFRCFESSALCLVVGWLLSDTRAALLFYHGNAVSFQTTATDKWSMEAQDGLVRLNSSETMANTRWIKCNCAAPVMQEDSLANGLGHLFPLQGFWVCAHPDLDMPRTHKYPGMQYPRHVTNREVDQSVERHQPSLLNKLDQMRTHFKIGKWQEYSKFITYREQVKQAPWLFTLKLAGESSFFPPAHQERKFHIFQLGTFWSKDVTAKILKYKPTLSK